MKIRLFTLAGLILIGIFAACPTPTGEGRASYTVGGIVTIAGDDSAAAGALVQLKQTGVAIGDPVQTGDDGAYTIPGVFAGNYTIDVALEGYDPGTIAAFRVSGNIFGKDLYLKRTGDTKGKSNLETGDDDDTGGDGETDGSVQTGDTGGSETDDDGETDGSAETNDSAQTGAAGTQTGAASGSETDGAAETNGSAQTGAAGDGETEPPDAVSGASTAPAPQTGGSSGGSDRVITETPIPGPLNTFTGGFGTVLNKVKEQPSGGAYLVELTNSATRPPYDMTGFNTPVTIVIDGKGKYVSLAGGYDGKGSLLTIPAGVTVFLKDITLKGCDTNTKAIITVAAGGKLVMKEGAEITGAARSPVDGGAVRVNAGGSFVMDGGYIRGNTGISNGGAVFISGGEFIMTGGEISGNQASNTGGVFMYNGGEFIMTGGKISGNTSKNYAGGVLVNGGHFEMRGGSIADNTCHLYGGGVFIGYYSHLSGSSGGVFVQKGGTISGNKSAGGGGGVSLRGSSAVFVLKGGEISGNKAVPDDTIDPYGGGGVFVQDGGIFICEEGRITNNSTAYELWGGGGVLVQTKDDGSGFGGADAVSGASSVSGGGGGGGTTYRPGITLVGGVITGNSAGNGRGQSIYHGIGDFTLAGSPSINGAVCIEYQPATAKHISIDGDFTGTTVTLDLRGNENGITFTGNWMRPLLAMSGGGSIPASVRSRFTLRNFSSYSGKQSQSLSGYTIGENGTILTNGG
jgi:hypothetical protein